MRVYISKQKILINEHASHKIHYCQQQKGGEFEKIEN